MNHLTVRDAPIEGLKIIERSPVNDARGYFERLFCQSELKSILGTSNICQVNHTFTRTTGAVRGLHFQYPPYAETKIVTCLKGRVWDIALDLRKDSNTFLKYYAIELSEENFRTYLIPPGFAHGFQTLAPDSELLYFHTAEYHSNAEGGVNALDPRLAIPWPLKFTERSERDKAHPMLNEQFMGIEI